MLLRYREAKTKTEVVELQLSLLLNVGLLTRHSAAQDRYLFAMPNAGPIVRAIIAGRKVSPCPSLHVKSGLCYAERSSRLAEILLRGRM